MAVVIRMMRLGRRHRPFYRINAMDSRCPRNGRILEKLGHYDPIEKDVEKQVLVDTEKAQAWIDKGAKVSDSVAAILTKKGMTIKSYEESKARRLRAKAFARKAGKAFDSADRAAEKKAAEAAAEAAKAAEAAE